MFEYMHDSPKNADAEDIFAEFGDIPECITALNKPNPRTDDPIPICSEIGGCNVTSCDY